MVSAQSKEWNGGDIITIFNAIIQPPSLRISHLAPSIDKIRDEFIVICVNNFSFLYCSCD